MTGVRILVSGKVQGVFFRQSTKEFASKLGLCGFVRNLKNGQVEIVVNGKEEEIECLIDWVKEGGPPAANISDVYVAEIDIEAKSEFQIL